ncbi:protein GOLVEN 7-like [Brassica napus]|nr:protein GOLVEN 7-like [Brassica napus]
MTTLSKIICVLIILFLCISFRYSLHDGNQESSRDVVSVRKVTENGDVVIRGRKLMMTNGEAEKETTMNRKRKSGKSVDEDGLVAFTADYWRAKPKHHPPRNN